MSKNLIASICKPAAGVIAADALATIKDQEREIENLKIAIMSLENSEKAWEKSFDCLSREYRTFIDKVSVMRLGQLGDKHGPTAITVKYEKAVDQAIQDYRRREAETELPFS